MLHFFQTIVIVGKLVQMSQGNFAGNQRIVITDIGARIDRPVLQLNIHSPPELVNIKPVPFQTKFFSYLFCLLTGKYLFYGHFSPPFEYL